MSIELTDFERGAPFTGDYAAELGALQSRLCVAQQAQIFHRRRVIILFEGWLGGGKKLALKRLVAALDPCFVTVHDVGVPGAFDEDRHWLAPFWNALPAAGRTAIFFRSWYRRAAEASATGKFDAKALSRTLDEVNEFESQQRDHDTLLVKLFFHVSEEVQQDRLREKAEDPWERVMLTAIDVERAHRHAAYRPVLMNIFDQTNTRWAPWKLIDAANREAAQIAALGHIAEVIEKAIPQQPPVDHESAEILDFPKFRRR